jgi:hypothetical protein
MGLNRNPGNFRFACTAHSFRYKCALSANAHREPYPKVICRPANGIGNERSRRPAAYDPTVNASGLQLPG